MNFRLRTLAAGAGALAVGPEVGPEAVPGLGDDDGVGGVGAVVADLYGVVEAQVLDEGGEGGDVLGALVGDAGDAVAVDDGVGLGFGGGYVDEGSVDDAAEGGEAFAAALLALGGGGAALEHDDDGCNGDCGGSSGGDGADGKPMLHDIWVHIHLPLV